jgi:hypothetical protein
MKRSTLLRALLGGVPVLLLGMISCPEAVVQNPYQDRKPGTFWAQNWATKQYYTVESVLLAEGEKCVVWAERSAWVPVAEGEAIAREYDSRIYEKIVDVFGSDEIMAEYDMDGDGKLTLLLLDIQDGFRGSGAYTAGYFSRNDLFSSNHSNNHSNERDMIYVDTNPSRLRSEESYATIAHELQHFINFSSRFSAGRELMDTWIDEGLSAAAEQIYLGRHNRDRVSHFNASETIRKGNNFFVWGERPDSILDEYATVYLFFQWLEAQSEGTDIFRRIIDSEHPDYRAVTDAISTTFTEKPDSTSWDTVLRSWLAANYFNSPDGLYGYRGKFSELRVWALGGKTWQLLPGEGVYSAVGGAPGAFPGGGGGPNIKYAGLSDRTAGSEPRVSLETLYPKGRLLTFNGNEKEDHQAGETGLLADGEAETIRRVPFAGTGRSAAGDSWIIDARDLWGRPEHGHD